jgi:hypothetical protein
MKPYNATYSDGSTVALATRDAIEVVANARSTIASSTPRSRAEARGLLSLLDEEGLDGLFFEDVTIRLRAPWMTLWPRLLALGVLVLGSTALLLQHYHLAAHLTALSSLILVVDIAGLTDL